MGGPETHSHQVTSRLVDAPHATGVVSVSRKPPFVSALALADGSVSGRVRDASRACHDLSVKWVAVSAALLGPRPGQVLVRSISKSHQVRTRRTCATGGPGCRMSSGAAAPRVRRIPTT